MNNITALERVFNYQNRRLRTVQQGGEYWFVVQDVCSALDVGNSRAATAKLIRDDVGLIDTIDSLGRHQQMSIINEAGLYTLALGSRKPEAKAFGHWITHEVLPALRRSGVYRLAGEQTSEENGGLVPLSRRQLLNLALEAETECEGLRQENAAMRPKAEFYDAVADSEDSFSLGETAKMIGLSGYGRNNLIRFLRARGILMADNVAKQRYVERGYFRIVQSDYYAADGSLRVKAVTRVYEKGIEFIRRQLADLPLAVGEQPS